MYITGRFEIDNGFFFVTYSTNLWFILEIGIIHDHCRFMAISGNTQRLIFHKLQNEIWNFLQSLFQMPGTCYHTDFFIV
jgi:hypothetical protein